MQCKYVQLSVELRPRYFHLTSVLHFHWWVIGFWLVYMLNVKQVWDVINKYLWINHLMFLIPLWKYYPQKGAMLKHARRWRLHLTLGTCIDLDIESWCSSIMLCYKRWICHILKRSESDVGYIWPGNTRSCGTHFRMETLTCCYYTEVYTFVNQEKSIILPTTLIKI